MTRHRPHAVLLLFLLLIFATPAVGQEAGQRARGEIIPASIHFGLFPTSTVEGLLTPDLLQLEVEGGTIIARDDLINPEYFVVNRPLRLFYGLAGGIGLLAVVEVFRSCDFEIILDIQCPGYSWPLVIGVGSILGGALLLLPVDVDPSIDPGEWKPW
jgi:hypothetical protein